MVVFRCHEMVRHGTWKYPLGKGEKNTNQGSMLVFGGVDVCQVQFNLTFDQKNNSSTRQCISRTSILEDPNKATTVHSLRWHFSYDSFIHLNLQVIFFSLGCIKFLQAY